MTPNQSHFDAMEPATLRSQTGGVEIPIKILRIPCLKPRGMSIAGPLCPAWLRRQAGLLLFHQGKSKKETLFLFSFFRKRRAKITAASKRLLREIVEREKKNSSF